MMRDSTSDEKTDVGEEKEGETNFNKKLKGTYYDVRI